MLCHFLHRPPTTASSNFLPHHQLAAELVTLYRTLHQRQLHPMGVGLVTACPVLTQLISHLFLSCPMKHHQSSLIADQADVQLGKGSTFLVIHNRRFSRLPTIRVGFQVVDVRLSPVISPVISPVTSLAIGQSTVRKRRTTQTGTISLDSSLGITALVDN